MQGQKASSIYNQWFKKPRQNLDKVRYEWVHWCLLKAACVHLKGGRLDAFPLSFSPAGVDRAHGRWRKVGVVLNSDRLLHMVLADVLVHLIYSQWLPVLEDTTKAS